MAFNHNCKDFKTIKRLSYLINKNKSKFFNISYVKNYDVH